jgi:hypothetical protein
MQYNFQRPSQGRVEIIFSLNHEEVAFLSIERSNHEKEIIRLNLLKPFGERTASMMLFDGLVVNRYNGEAIEFWLEQAGHSLDRLGELFDE